MDCGAYGERTITAYNYLALSHLDFLKIILCTLPAHFDDDYLSVIWVQRYNRKPKQPSNPQSIFTQGLIFNIHKDFTLTKNTWYTGGVLIVYMMLRTL